MNLGCNLRDLATAHPLELNEMAGQKIAVDVFLNAFDVGIEEDTGLGVEGI